MPLKVSVIIPTHKRPQYLGRAVDSVLSQTYDNVEAVVVDDNAPGSEERHFTEKAMERYAGNSKVVYCLNEKPIGGGPARNKGIEAASGDYITFLDDDDIYLPDKIERQLVFTVENGLEMSFTDVYLHGPDGKLVEYRRHNYVKDCSNTELLRQHILHSLGPTSTFMVKRDILLAAGGFEDVPMGQDFMLMWRMIEFGTKIGYLPGSDIIQYLHRGERISVGKNKIEGEKRLYNLKKTKIAMLTPRERKYLDFRHNAVLCVTFKRSEKPAEAVRYGLKAFGISPVFAVLEMVKILKNRYTVKRMKSVSQGL